MFEDNENFYPAKPELIQQPQGSKYTRLLVSMALFFVVFIVFVPQNYILGTEVIVILLLHELGHLIMMKRFGYKSLNMLFIPLLGAMVSGSKVNVSQKQKVLISLMGPLPGILLGCVLFLIGANMTVADPILIEFSILLICINVVNLIPLDPLDGGNTIEALFFPSNEKIRLYFTLFSSLIMIALGVLLDFFPLLIFGFLMSFKVRAYQKNKAIHDDLQAMDLNYKKEYSDLSDREYWTMRRVFLENNPKIKDIIPEDDTNWENEKLLVEQVNSLLRCEVKEDLSWAQRIFFCVLLLAGLVLPVVLLWKNYHVIEWFIGHAGF